MILVHVILLMPVTTVQTFEGRGTAHMLEVYPGRVCVVTYAPVLPEEPLTDILGTCVGYDVVYCILVLL